MTTGIAISTDRDRDDRFRPAAPPAPSGNLARFEMNDEVVSDFGVADANTIRMIHGRGLPYVYYKEVTRRRRVSAA